MPDGAGRPPVLYAGPADMAARFGLQELIALAPLPDSEALPANGPPVFADRWPESGTENQREEGEGSGGPLPPYDAARVNDALERASREADSYLAVRLPVPLDTAGGIPQPLGAAVCDMARYHLCAGFGMQDSEAVERRYREALAWLREVARGAAAIVVPAPPEAPLPQAPEPEVIFRPGRHERFF